MRVTPVPPRCLDLAVSHLEAGKRLAVCTHLRVTVITLKHWREWEKSGRPMLREEGDGFRMASGKGSVYLFPGQLRFVEE